MVSFVSLFLGLLIGVHPVELAVDSGVAEVRLLLDGRQVALLDGEPWRVDCDFGEELRPHELTALAFDADGEEVGRARQWVNLPRGRAESALALESSAEGKPLAARLIWENLEDLSPLSVSVTLDGRPLAGGEDGRYPLPELDPAALHILAAAMEFEDGTTSRAEHVFGGDLADRIEVEMTAVPLRRRSASAELSITDLASTLSAGGASLPVLALEEGRAEIVAVVENGAVPILRSHGVVLETSATVAVRFHQMKPGDTLRVQSTVPLRRSDRETPLDLFPITPAYSARQGSLSFLMSHVGTGPQQGQQQIADAVAVAGVEAASGNRARAVVLVLGNRWRDRSRFSVDAARRFLTELRVPLLVWSTGPLRTGPIAEDRMPLSRRTEWGRAKDVSSFTRYLEGISDLRRELDRQLIAWVPGAHLPREIALSKQARDVELAD